MPENSQPTRSTTTADNCILGGPRRFPAASAKTHDPPTQPSTQLTVTLQRLHDKARRGELTGLCYVAYDAEGWEADAIGRPRTDPDRAVGILHRLIQRILRF